MAIFDLLKEEHDQIRELLAIMQTEGKKGEAFEQGRTKVETHMDGEEEHVYPEVRAVGLKTETLEAVEEHHVARMVLGELDDMSDREETWPSKLGVFAELVEHHIRQEERNVFPEAARRISRARQQELEDEYRRFTSALVQAGTSLPKSESPFYQGV
ncbi:MAG: hemerythrin domain-containing protein [Phycisphaerales bacterium]|jgi:hemerythrin-like domain-containing protein